MKTEDITLFHRIVENGGVNETANVLRIPKSTLSRRLKALEDELSLKLFHRHGRELILTTAGSHFYQKTRGIMTELDQTISDLSHDEAPLTGSLRLQVLPIPEVKSLFDIVFNFMELHPKLKVEVFATPEPLDMIKHSLDVAFRIDKQIEDADLVARPLFQTEVHFYATPEYLAQYGIPVSVEQLSQHQCIMYRFLNTRVFNELPEIGNVMGVKMNGNLLTNSVSFAKQAALRGKGIALLPKEYVQSEVASKKLIKILPELDSICGKYNIVYPSRAFLSLAASRFIDFVIEQLEQIPTDKFSKDVDDAYWF
ncbi:MAG: LysR family transcriptional regulator [Parashewanella sp.]